MIEKNFLFLRASSLGDILHTLPCAQYLKKHIPASKLTWVVEEEYVPLLRAFPIIDEVIGIPFRKFRKGRVSFFQLIRSLTPLRKRRWDLSFDFQGNTKSGLFHLVSSSKRKVGSYPAKEVLNRLSCNERFPIQGEQIQYQYLSLLCQALSLPMPSSLPIFDRGGESSQRLLVAPFSHWDSKVVPFERLEEVLSVPYDVIYGSEEEAERCAGFFSKASSVYVQPSFTEWIALTKRSLGVVCVDSAQLHLAALFNVPTFSFFGPSSPHRYAPFGEVHSAIEGKCPLGISFNGRCPLLRSCTNKGCIKRLPPFEHKFDVWLTKQKLQKASQN